MERSSDDCSNQTKAGSVFSTVFITGTCFVERVKKNQFAEKITVKINE